MKPNHNKTGLALAFLALLSTLSPQPSILLAQTGPGSALSFDGVDDFVSIGGAPIPTPWTAEFWVNRQNAFDDSAILLGGTNAMLKLEQWQYTRRVGFTQLGVADYLFNYTVPVGTWVHLAFVGSTDTKLYVNGALQDVNLATISLPLGQIGGDMAGRYNNHMRGAIDEVRVWNVARSQADIQANMYRALSLPQPNLVAYWRFDEGTGASAYDGSGNGWTGTLMNGPVWVPSTAPFVPGVATLPASQISPTSATLNGLVNPNGVAATAWFQWGPTTSYGHVSGTTGLPVGSTPVLISLPISGLSANQVFNYRIVASNPLGLAFGDNQVSVSDLGIPRLSIALAETNAVLSWSAAASSFTLESSANIRSPGNWLEVATLPQVSGADYAVTLPIQAADLFFRLHQGSAPTPAFNSAPASNLGAESAVNPAGGAPNDPSYSQGIGQVSGIGSSPGDTGLASYGVLLNNGELVECAVDLAVPGRGFNWKMERKYRSGITFDGPLGHNWDFSYNRRLVVTNNGDVLRMDGYGRADRYTNTTGGYVAPRGCYAALTPQDDGTFLERDRHGSKVYYSATNSQGIARMTELRDRNGNRMQFQHNNLGQLCRVLDTLGRAFLYRYDSVTGRLIEVDDFAGRSIRYRYDLRGDLVAVTSPAVVGTPTGNDFPDGKTWQYAYSSGSGDERLNHNLLTITAPNEVAESGPPFLTAEYQTNTASADVDRLLHLTIGGVNASGVPAGGTISYLYQSLGSAPPNDFNTAVFQTTVTDRNGNQIEHRFNQLGNTVRTREFTRGFRNAEPAYYQTLYQYNSDGQMLSRTNPLGSAVVHTYDSPNPDRFQQGNLLATTRYPDASRGGDQAFIQTTNTYEPIYNQVLTFTSARGTDGAYVPQNGGANTLGRYTTTYTYDYQEGQDYASLATELGISQIAVQGRLTGVPMNLGDVNADSQTSQAHGNRIRNARPTVTLLPGSNEAAVEGTTHQPIVTLYAFNQFGQITRETDPEANVTQYAYNPENDPTGGGTMLTAGVGAGPFGYLNRVVADAVSAAAHDSGANPAPTAITTAYAYDSVGNATRTIDARGVATDYAVNQLNQVVQITRAAAHNLATNNVPEPLPLTDFQYLARIYYDTSNREVRRQVEDRGNTSNTGGFVDTVSQYDILNHVVQTTSEVAVNTHLITRFRYDANGNRTLTLQPEGNATTARYDERNLVFQVTAGATSPSPGTLGTITIGGSRGGTPATYTFNYDQNGNLIESVDAADTDGSPANNSSIAGFGDVTRSYYDGFDRPVRRVDAVGNQNLYNYDPAGSRVLSTRRGPVGGASPTNTLGSANVNLSIVESRYDELSRLYQEDRQLFVPAGVATQRTPNITDGPLTPGDNKVTTRHEYDRNSRQTFSVADDLRTTHSFYDGANRIIKSSDVLGNTVETAYDGNGNVIETRQTDVCQLSTVPNEIFIATLFYDSLGRLQRRVDNVGQTFDYRYDSRGNLVAQSDPNGPVSGSISRRAFSGGTSTTNAINGFGNVTLYTYDGLGRKTREDRVMTASGKGDGVNIGADIFGIKSTTPAPDLTQAGGDGLITARYQWDGNSLLTTLTDDNGNQTAYTYDNLNRQLTETKGICVSPNLANTCSPPTTVVFQYDQDGNKNLVMDENGSIVTNRFDAINRLITRQVTRGSNVVGTTLATFQYDGLSRLVRATDNNDPADPSDDSASTFAYDSLGHKLEETQQIGSETPKAISSSWNSSRLRTSLTYPNGRTITNTFDQLDRVTTIADLGAGTPIATYSYIGGGRVAERDYPLNGTRLTYLDNSGTQDVGYDGLRRPVQLRHLAGATSMVVGFGHAYDRGNNPLIEKKLHSTNDSELYQYDSGHRLLHLARGTLDGSNSSIVLPSLHTALQTNWTLDGVGNWQNVDNETRLHNSFNEIIQRSNTVATAILSDKNGNETDNGTLSFHYDYRNRLRKVTRKSDAALLAIYAYDAQNRRISKVVTNSGALNGTNRYYLSGWREIEERNGTNGLVQQFVYGRYIDEPLELDRNLNGDNTATGAGDQRLFYHQNKQHSVFALTDLTGRIVEAYLYDAYGVRTVFNADTNGVVHFGGDDIVSTGGASSFCNPFGFTGRQLDSESGLYYYRNRYLSPEQGRFVSRDPLSYRGGGMGLSEYVRSSPTAAGDPFGLGLADNPEAGDEDVCIDPGTQNQSTEPPAQETQNQSTQPPAQDTQNQSQSTQPTAPGTLIGYTSDGTPVYLAGYTSNGTPFYVDENGQVVSVAQNGTPGTLAGYTSDGTPFFFDENGYPGFAEEVTIVNETRANAGNEQAPSNSEAENPFNWTMGYVQALAPTPQDGGWTLAGKAAGIIVSPPIVAELALGEFAIHDIKLIGGLVSTNSFLYTALAELEPRAFRPRPRVR